MFSKNERKFCPLIKKSCIGTDCMFNVKLRGNDPNTGKEIDDEACAVAWMPMLMIENTMVSNQTGAAVESFRNETVKGQQQAMTMIQQQQHKTETYYKQNGISVVKQNLLENED